MAARPRRPATSSDAPSTDRAPEHGRPARAVEAVAADDAALPGFGATVVAWQRQHGRQSLPWQQLGATRDAYRVWLAEVMLQQTQVAAVIPFYRRFVDRFPDVRALAGASLDDVMQCWSGLGYYSRARNLHAAARRVVDVHDGVFPDTVDALQALPGVGRSTAGAVAAFAHGRKAAILDGNVKRVLMRVHAIDGVPNDVAVTRRLWRVAEAALPDHDIERYTQGLMDLGATICTPRRPACLLCPLASRCLAHRAGLEEAYPRRSPRRPLPERRATLLLVTRGGEVLLERRPATGVWGGLWSLPEIAHDGTTDAGADVGDRSMVTAAIAEHGTADSVEPVPGFVHAFTHFVLHADVVHVRLDPEAAPTRVAEPSAATRWIARDALSSVGLPAPVRALLARPLS